MFVDISLKPLEYAVTSETVKCNTFFFFFANLFVKKKQNKQQQADPFAFCIVFKQACNCFKEN